MFIKYSNFDLVCEFTEINEKVGLIPNSNPLHLSLVFEVPTGKILGAQAIGKGNADKRIDVIATLITMGEH